MLEQGELDVNVTKNRGKFDVAVGKAVVRVIGTRFQVGVMDEEVDDRWVKKLRVVVQEGTVAVDPGNGSSATLTAGAEKVFDLSPEPTRVEPAVVTPERLLPGGAMAARRGAAAGAGEGARPGLIRGNFTVSTGTRPEGAAGPGPGRGLPFAARGGAVAAPVGRAGAPLVVPGKTVQIVTNHGVVEMAGMLRHDGDSGFFYLQPDQGGQVFLVFPQQLPQPPLRGWGPNVSRRMKVTWRDGVVEKIEQAGPQVQSGTF